MAEGNDAKAESDVIEILADDHKEMIELISRIESTPDLNERRDLADTVIAEVMRHAVAEEMFVYPVIEEHVPNGTDEVEHDKQEHEQIVRVMKDLEKTDPSDPAFMQLVRSLEGLLRHHADDEENDQFPKLRAHISSDELIDIGRRVENAKKLAPTRPHPHAPHSELFHKTIVRVLVWSTGFWINSRDARPDKVGQQGMFEAGTARRSGISHKGA